MNRGYNANTAVVALKDENLNKLQVIRDDTLDKSKNSTLDMSKRLPIFILASGAIDDLNAIYAQYLCNSLNNDGFNKYLAAIKSIKNQQDAINYLKKDNLTINPKMPLVADFLITRTDYLFEKIKQNTGPLKDQPTLDVVMFLNGEYLFLWGNNKYKSIELSNLFDTNKSSKTFVVAVNNDLAATLIKKIISANKPETKLEIVVLKKLNKLKLKKLNKYDIIAYSGPSINNNLLKTIHTSGSKFVPLTIADNMILNTQKVNPEISSINTTDFYGEKDILNASMLLTNKDDANSVIKTKYNKNKDNSRCNSSKEKIPFVNNSKYSKYYDECVFGKSRFNFNILSLEEALEDANPNTKLLKNIKGISIKGIGIRNVLVANRNTDISKVFELANAFLSNYNSVRSTYITTDMRKIFIIKDLITGNLYNNSLTYHYGILNFATYAKNNNYIFTSGDDNIPELINNSLTKANSPAFYGPEVNSNELNEVNKIFNSNNIYKSKKEVIDSLKLIIDSIKTDLSSKDNS